MNYFELTNRCRALHIFDFISIKSIINLLRGTDKSVFMKEIYVDRKGVRNPPKQSNRTEKQTMKKKKPK